MREASTVTPPSSISRQVPNLKPWCDTSSPVTEESTSLARGPHRPSVVHAEVRSLIAAVPSPGSCSANHFRSAIPVAPPVTTRNRRGPSRMIVRSPRKPPRSSSSEVYTTRPTLTSICATATDWTASSAPGPVMSNTAHADQAARVPHRQVLGVDDRRPPARLPLGLALHQPPGVALEQAGVRAVPVGPLPARGLDEHRAQVALAVVYRGEPAAALGLPLLGRVDDPVHLVEALAGPRGHVRGGPLVAVEPGDV